MPLKKSVKKLEDICLQSIPTHLQNIFNSLLLNVKSLYEKKEHKRVINYRNFHKIFFCYKLKINIS